MNDNYKLQYISDIHLEFRKNNIPIIEPIEPGNTYLALCGDIGNPYLPSYRKFMTVHSKKFVHILVVSGNHEYYTSKNKQRTINMIDMEIKTIVSGFDNITYLNMNGVIIGRTKFIGCTFWSDVSSILDEAEIFMNDYKNIYVDCQELSSRFVKINDCWGNSRQKYIRADRRIVKSFNILSIHKTMKEWLKTQLNKQSDKYDHIIVMTHHAPSFSMLVENDETLSYCYASDCDELFKPPMSYWISGHTHICQNIAINDIPSISNCMGYPDEKVEGYDNNKYITFS